MTGLLAGFPDKPWMDPLPGETQEDWITRLSRMCTACGRPFLDAAVREAHTETCMGPGDEGLPSWLFA